MTGQPANRDEVGVRQFVEQLGGLYEASGMARIPARLMALFLADEDGRLSSAQICEALEVSPAAVSQATKVLVTMGMIRVEREPGSKRNVYVLTDDDWYTRMLREDRSVALNMQILGDAVAAVGGTGTRAGRRLALSVELFRLLDENLRQVMQQWEQRKAELLAQPDLAQVEIVGDGPGQPFQL